MELIDVSIMLGHGNGTYRREYNARSWQWNL